MSQMSQKFWFLRRKLIPYLLRIQFKPRFKSLWKCENNLFSGSTKHNSVRRFFRKIQKWRLSTKSLSLFKCFQENVLDFNFNFNLLVLFREAKLFRLWEIGNCGIYWIYINLIENFKTFTIRFLSKLQLLTIPNIFDVV